MFKIMSVGASLISAWRLRNLGVTGWDELLAPRQLQRTPVTSGAQTPHSTLKESAFRVRAHLLHRMFSRILVWIILSPHGKMPWLLSAHSPVQSDFYPEWEESGCACSTQASVLELSGLGKPCWQARVGEKC